MDYTKFFYPETEFGGFTDIDGTVNFYNRVNALLTESSVVLDIGCGRGEYGEDPSAYRRKLRILKGKAAKVIGIDLDRRAAENPFIDEFHLMQGDTWPISDEAIDVIVCDNVLEHVEHPDRFFHEVQRVLRKNGYLCIRTTNRFSYLGLAASLIPNKYHAKVLSVVQDGRKEEDVFPTVYKCNRIGKVRKCMEKCGLHCVAYGYEPEPGYFHFSVIAYWCGVLFQKFAPKFIKTTIIAFGVKK